MKKILKYITLLVVTVMCTSCGEYSMKGDTFTVVKEENFGNDTLSLYTLEYKDNRLSGTGIPTSELEVIMNKNAFEVGDKVKLVKVEE
jgi:hypothetical protein